MPRRKLTPARSSSIRDIEAIRQIIRAGVPWLPQETHYPATRNLTLEQKCLLANLTPFRSAAKFLAHLQLDADLIEAAREMLKDDIARGEKDRKSEPSRFSTEN